jgi:hypothetical protein
MISERTNKTTKRNIMTKEEIFKSKGFKILLPIIVVALAIALWTNGYGFGQWLHSVLN